MRVFPSDTRATKGFSQLGQSHLACLVGSSQYKRITERLEALKDELNLGKE